MTEDVKQEELISQMTKLPPYVKRWYEQRAKKFGQKTQPYVSLILIQHALENGAAEDKMSATEELELTTRKEKPQYGFHVIEN